MENTSGSIFRIIISTAVMVITGRSYANIRCIRSWMTDETIGEIILQILIIIKNVSGSRIAKKKLFSVPGKVSSI